MMTTKFKWHRIGKDKTSLKNLLLRCTRRSKGQCNAVSSQCQALNKKTKKFEIAINNNYVKNKMIPHISHALVAMSAEDESIQGILLGSEKKLRNSDGKSYKVFYIDLVCSRHRKGKDLLYRAEIFALQKGFHTIALRAATPKLLNVYRRRGYSRDVDACQTRTRAQRRALREMDMVASALFKGDRRFWKTSGDGWWMSKCCRKNIQALKVYIRAQKNKQDRDDLKRQLNQGIRKINRRR